ncbi:MAG TPA: DUF2147 domain-containing protein [Rhizobacter sp.]|nr:DUF2147 domain-containing protein [Rhizobacter sp.]
MKKVLMALAATIAMTSAMAQSNPAGLWKSIDDSSKTEKSLIRITESNGIYTGRIEKLLGPDAKPDAVCDECSGADKGKPIVGMTIIRGIKKNAESEGLWDGGTVLDPANGKIYKLRLKPSEDGKKLEVRGYVGAPMFGRSQTWHKAD